MIYIDCFTHTQMDKTQCGQLALIITVTNLLHTMNTWKVWTLRTKKMISNKPELILCF